MIKCNLPVLLAERGLKITKLSNDTGISRTTLTSLSNNYSQGIQFDTLNKICNYLKITPGELFLYVPFEINFNFGYGDIFTVGVTDGNQKFECDFCWVLEKSEREIKNLKGDFLGYKKHWEFFINNFEVLDAKDNTERIKEKEKIKIYLKQLPIVLYKMLEKEILEEINDKISQEQERALNAYEISHSDIEDMDVDIYFDLDELFNSQD